jgi:hypothetical protein
LKKHVAFRDDAENGAVVVDDRHAGDSPLDEQPGDVLQRRRARDGDDVPRETRRLT